MSQDKAVIFACHSAMVIPMSRGHVERPRLPVIRTVMAGIILACAQGSLALAQETSPEFTAIVAPSDGFVATSGALIPSPSFGATPADDFASRFGIFSAAKGEAGRAGAAGPTRMRRPVSESEASVSFAF